MRILKSRIAAIVILLVCIPVFLDTTGRVESSGTKTIFLPIIVQGDAVWPIGPDGGHIVSIDIDPGNSAVMYAGTWGAGVYKSIDSGSSWFLTNSGLDNYYINTIAIDPIDPSILYLGTQKGGVYKSTDSGSSWVAAGAGLNPEAIVYSIAIDPSTPTTLYAGTRSPGSQPPWGGGVYKSIDGGNTWQVRNQGLGEEWVYSIAINPMSPNTLYAATHAAGVYKSVDGASTWSAANTGLTDGSTRSLVIDLNNPQTLFVGTWHHGGVFRTTNGAASWSQVDDGLNGAKIYRLEMDSNSSQTIYAATWMTGVYKTVNGGDVWNSSGLWPDFVYDVAVDPDTNSNVYAGTAGDGLYKSIDSGGNWSRRDTGLKATSVTSLEMDPDSPATMYASVFGGGIYKTSNRGETWMSMNSGLEDKSINAIAMAPEDPLTLYVATNGSGVYKSTDGGGSWNSLNLGLPSLTSDRSRARLPFSHHLENEFVDGGMLEEFSLTDKDLPFLTFGGTDLSVKTIEIDQTSSSVVFIGTDGNGVYKSLNSGGTWSATGLTTGVVNDLAIDPSNPNNIFAAVGETDGCLLRTFDGGTSWIFMNTGLNGHTTYAVLFDPSTPGKMLVGNKDGVYLSTNGGNSWGSATLAGVRVYSLEINQGNSNLIYAGTTEGFYISLDGGSNWTLDNGRLVNPIVQSIELDDNGGWIYLGSQGSGSYRRGGMLP